MGPKAVEVTRADLLARRAEIVRQLGMSLEEFEACVSRGKLLGEEWYLAREIEEIQFLLGDDR